jgi:membrane-bound lytic murein transglycosylase D
MVLNDRLTRYIGLIVIGLFLGTGFFGCGTVQTSSTAEEKPDSTTRMSADESSTHRSSNAVFVPMSTTYFPPPESIDLCGEPVPLHLDEVQERFDKEFTLVVYNHAQVYLWLKRMERYFPWIEERLRHYNLPDDLKYVAIVESDLQPNVCSPKGAAGPWQFMPATGTAYGLEQQGSYDCRYDFERATDSAFRLLQDLNKRYKNWALAIAAYNCGDKRILEGMRSQGVSDYYHLKLPLETERYVFRILAIKAVLGSPNQYGYHLPKGHGYAELQVDRVNVSLSSPVSMQTVASAAGTTFREVKRLNPTFRADEIPAGTYEIKLPSGKGRTFEKNFASLKAQPIMAAVEAKPSEMKPPVATEVAKASPEKKPEPAKPQPPKPAKAPVEKSHTVKKGETLSSIAKQYKVGVDELKQLNKMKGNDLGMGQKLRIP